MPALHGRKEHGVLLLIEVNSIYCCAELQPDARQPPRTSWQYICYIPNKDRIKIADQESSMAVAISP